MDVNPRSWFKALFQPHNKSDVCENNISKSFNGFIIKARYKSIISLLEHIRNLIMKRNVERRNFINSRFEGEFRPRLWVKIGENIEACSKFMVA